IRIAIVDAARARDFVGPSGFGPTVQQAQRIAELVLRPSVPRAVAQANLEVADRSFELPAELAWPSAGKGFVHELVGTDLAQRHAGLVRDIDFVRDRACQRDGEAAGAAALSRAGDVMAVGAQQVIAYGQLRALASDVRDQHMIHTEDIPQRAHLLFLWGVDRDALL